MYYMFMAVIHFLPSTPVSQPPPRVVTHTPANPPLGFLCQCGVLRNTFLAKKAAFMPSYFDTLNWFASFVMSSLNNFDSRRMKLPSRSLQTIIWIKFFFFKVNLRSPFHPCTIISLFCSAFCSSCESDICNSNK